MSLREGLCFDYMRLARELLQSKDSIDILPLLKFCFTPWIWITSSALPQVRKFSILRQLHIVIHQSQDEQDLEFNRSEESTWASMPSVSKTNKLALPDSQKGASYPKCR